jgi:hypothetical protein
MDDHQKRIEDKLDRLDERMDKMNETLIKNTVVLDEHQRRSIASENRLEVVEKQATFVNNMIKIVTVGGGLLVFLSQLLPLVDRLLK